MSETNIFLKITMNYEQSKDKQKCYFCNMSYPGTFIFQFIQLFNLLYTFKHLENNHLLLLL